MKVFSTKYALTAGIQELEAEETSIPGMVSVPAADRHAFSFNLHAGEWFLSREEAVADAIKRRDRKIASIKKSLVKMEKLTF